MEFEEGKQNLLEFIENKVNNFKSVLRDLTNDKEKFEKLEKSNQFNKSKLLLSIMFLNEDNKVSYIEQIMEKCSISNNENIFSVINSYFEMLFEIKQIFLKSF